MMAVACVATVVLPDVAGASDPLCLGNYGSAPARAAASLRFGIDPAIAGSAGGVQLPTVPDNPARDLAAVKQLQPEAPRSGHSPESPLLVRGQQRHRVVQAHRRQLHARRLRRRDPGPLPPDRHGGRQHPGVGDLRQARGRHARREPARDRDDDHERGQHRDLAEHVGRLLRPRRRCADRRDRGGPRRGGLRGYSQLRFGFTYAYRFSPTGDAALFSLSRRPRRRAVPERARLRRRRLLPGHDLPADDPRRAETYGAELAQALGTVRDCYLRLARIAAATPIWITENGVPTGKLSAPHRRPR